MAKKESSTTLGYEDKLWQAADKLRGSMDAAEYKHVVLGLIFLKYVSDAFETRQKQLEKEELADPEDKDEYISENVFWVPKEARWEEILKHANTPEIGQIIDRAMEAIEKENPRLKNVLNKNYARPELDKTRLGELVTLFTNLEIGTDKAKEIDMLGRVYEYFLSKFASAEGKNGGEFYTPACIVKTLVSMIEPFNGKVYDPCCGSGGMFVQSYKFVKEHQGNLRDVSIYGQERNPTTWKLAKMNLAIRQIDGNLGGVSAVIESIVSYYDQTAHLLQALPKEWNSGHLNGIHIPGGHIVSISWSNRMLSHLSVTLGFERSVQFEYQGRIFSAQGESGQTIVLKQ